MKKEVSEETQRQMKIVGQNIRNHRIRLDLSQEQLANMCGHTNSHARSWISKIESGTNDLPASELKLVAKALGVTCIELMKDPDEPNPEKVCELFKKCYGQNAFRMVQYFIKLDESDQKVVETMLTSLLSAEKYSAKKESSKKQIS